MAPRIAASLALVLLLLVISSTLRSSPAVLADPELTPTPTFGSKGAGAAAVGAAAADSAERNRARAQGVPQAAVGGVSTADAVRVAAAGQDASVPTTIRPPSTGDAGLR
jgi:hypothetical protein